jgi:hypothetical protein
MLLRSQISGVKPIVNWERATVTFRAVAACEACHIFEIRLAERDDEVNLRAAGLSRPKMLRGASGT